jgi:hypothetical protein
MAKLLSGKSAEGRYASDGRRQSRCAGFASLDYDVERAIAKSTRAAIGSKN